MHYGGGMSEDLILGVLINGATLFDSNSSLLSGILVTFGSRNPDTVLP